MENYVLSASAEVRLGDGGVGSSCLGQDHGLELCGTEQQHSQDNPTGKQDYIRLRLIGNLHYHNQTSF